ncbi:MAG: hypothetical protein LBS73_01625 [Campylobacteraceae bacterium]|jgi:hypothetical protein|nr:hypothetical protein [Campylobacteraceae bacterium]
MTRKIVILLMLSSCLLTAHKLNLFLYDENGTLYIQSYFTKSAPCKNCEVTIKDKSEKELLKLFTDDEGKASTPAVDDVLSVSVDGGMGHFQSMRYEMTSHTKDEAKELPPDAPWYKIVLSLCIIGVVFLILRLVKRKR